MKTFYTRSGDDGYTGLLGEGRVPKHIIRLEAVGTLDEATAIIGQARAVSQSDLHTELLLDVQRDLYNIMTEVAATPENAATFRKTEQHRVAWLEGKIDSLSEDVEIPNEFILPGDSPTGAAISIARSVVRRAERHIARLIHEDQIESRILLIYLNRLSSLLFILELRENEIFGKSTPTLARKK